MADTRLLMQMQRREDKGGTTHKLASGWRPAGGEIVIAYDPRQEDLYRRNDPSCIYHRVRWPLVRGTQRRGEFPVVVAREHFRKLGYSVRAGEPELPNEDGFLVLHFAGKRRQRHPAYMRMAGIFGHDVLEELNRVADLAKKRETKSKGGGDPDLFVFKGDGLTERFFVEVKHWDNLTKKQLVTFPLIERYLCEVKVARLQPGDGSEISSQSDSPI